MHSNLPQLALSIRQPWAWAVIHGGKDIENRSWQAVNRGLSKRGPIAIHAAKGMSVGEYITARNFMADIGVTCPHPAELVRGAIIGQATIIDIVSKCNSPWFMGSRGLVLQKPAPCEPIAVRGQLGFFNWHNNLLDALCSPLPWMVNFKKNAGIEMLFDIMEETRKQEQLFKKLDKSEAR